jgi:hypothetical protein
MTQKTPEIMIGAELARVGFAAIALMKKKEVMTMMMMKGVDLEILVIEVADFLLEEEILEVEVLKHDKMARKRR